MAAQTMLTKKVAISKANAQMVAVVAIAAFLTVFCLSASHAVWSLNSYHVRVENADDTANNQLEQDITAYNQLTNAYQSFASTPTNVLGGTISGNGSNNGNNAKIVLDALPPSYDFPGLTSSLEKILTTQGFSTGAIAGSDDELNQQNNTVSSNPSPVPMPFTLTLSNTSYTSATQLISALQQSIRPIAIDTMDLSGGGNTMSLSIAAHSYYQPSKNLSITTEVVK